ncbi:MAG TPA: sterol desaturase family protein [Thioalkalivibrio sp.]|mgnify:FL=1|nr:sterol desaturase family protein [Thioalkalivibrio sp.]
MDLDQIIMQYEPAIRLSAFLGVFALMAAWEVLAPRRQLTTPKWVRWSSNLGLVFLNTFLLRLAFPAAAVGVALLAQEMGWGLFNVVDVPFWFAILASVLIMDFVIWLQHVMVHAIPLLWRIHRMHHADLDFDVTTGSRFHPIEIFLSMGIKFATIVLLGPPVVAVVIFEVLLNATAMFNHSNIRLPLAVDRVLRLFIVTPDMHRVHHSIEDDETNSNFGFNLSIWDRLFGTYRAQPRAGHEGMTIGIRDMRETKLCAWLPGMLAIPFVGKVTGYAINRRQWGKSDD